MNWKNITPLLVVAAVVTACSPSVSTQLTAVYPPQPTSAVNVLEEDQIPNSAQPVGKVAVIDRGLGFKCQFDKLLEVAKAQAAAAGANGLVLSEPMTANDVPPCNQVYGTMFLMTDNKVDPSQPNPVLKAVSTERVAIANYRRKTKLPNHILKVNVGPSFMTKRFDLNGTKLKTKAGIDLSIDYARLWRTGWGFGFDLIHSMTNYKDNDFIKDADLSLTYIGPSLVWSRKTTLGWRWEGTFGLGYSHYRQKISGVSHSGGGFGVMSKIGVDYCITDKFAIGVEINEMNEYFKAPKEYNGDNLEFARINLQIGARYFF